MIETFARTTDPESSHVAAEEMNRTGRAARQAEIVTALVRAHPGCTSLELGAFGELDRYQVARSLPLAERAGDVRRGEIRVCRIGQRKALTWWPSARQLDLDLGVTREEGIPSGQRLG